MNISIFTLIFFLLFLLLKFVSTVPNSTFFLVSLFSVKLIFVAIWSGGLKSSSIKGYDSFYDLPFFVLEAEYQSPEASKEKDCNIRRKEDPSPCLALVEYKEEPLSTNKTKEEPLLATQKEEEEEEPLLLVEYIKEEVEPLVAAEYIEEEEALVVAEYMQEEPLLLEFYDVDDDEGEEDLRRRLEEEEQRRFEEEEQRKFEEFIAKHYRRWKEELVTDRLLCITAGA